MPAGDFRQGHHMSDELLEVPPVHPYAEALRQAGGELEIAKAAVINGNEGQARVCGRRAVGVFIQSIAGFLNHDYGKNVMANLRGIRDNTALPDEIRAAATRLNGGARSMMAGEIYSKDPLADAIIIINHFAVAAR